MITDHVRRVTLNEISQQDKRRRKNKQRKEEREQMNLLETEVTTHDHWFSLS
jgi:hypothetical protein